MLATFSGNKTWGEHWKLHDTLVLFNSASVA
jgi:hypothetical protein